MSRLSIAMEHLDSADLVFRACLTADLPYAVGCALIELESGGENIYGRYDEGGTLQGFPEPVNRDNFAAFRWMVVNQGMVSNGVGPAQITYSGVRRADGTRSGGLFLLMEREGLEPWVPLDNMTYGLRVLAAYRSGRTLAEAGTLYNAGNLDRGVTDYGRRFAEQVDVWRRRFREDA